MFQSVKTLDHSYFYWEMISEFCCTVHCMNIDQQFDYLLGFVPETKKKLILNMYACINKFDWYSRHYIA